MKLIDLNVDIGEGLPWDRELLQIATSANICVGGYAGSESLARQTAEMARNLGVAVGAHFGYEDPENFGRQFVDSADPMAVAMVARCQTVIPLLNPDYLKPHGAFYNDTASGRCLDRLAQIRAMTSVPMLGLPGSAHTLTGPVLREGFADRAYSTNGELIPRSVPGAVLTDLDEVCNQAVCLAERVDSICLHGDHDGCVARAIAVRVALESAGFTIRRYT